MNWRWQCARDVAWTTVVATCVKVLLLPAYHSTDFEVHRNWMAVTSSLSLSKWYVDATSPWTLDYPPLFAWFERALAVAAHTVDPNITHLTRGIDYATQATVLFQRASVMVSDLVLAYAVWRCCCFWLTQASNGHPRRRIESAVSKGESTSANSQQNHQQGWWQQHEQQHLRVRCGLVMAAVLVSPGLFIVDHIHFQYNGFLLGMLLLSIALIQEGNDVLAGVVFAVLCSFKHLFAVAGPWYVVFMLRAYCGRPPCTPSAFVARVAVLGASVATVLAAAFGPFVVLGQMPQLLSRLFPFGRGLCHAYWAPNFWALYNAADKVLHALCAFVARLPLPLPPALASAAAAGAGGSFTRGLVGDAADSHVVLPSVTPVASLALVLVAMVPCLADVWQHPQWHRAHAGASLAHVYLCAFAFGWHVHEKAIIHTLLPLALGLASSFAASAAAATEAPSDVSMANGDGGGGGGAKNVAGNEEAHGEVGEATWLQGDFEYLLLASAGHYSLFPLLFGEAEYPIKLLLLLLSSAGLAWALDNLGPPSNSLPPPLLPLPSEAQQRPAAPVGLTQGQGRRAGPDSSSKIGSECAEAAAATAPAHRAARQVQSGRRRLVWSMLWVCIGGLELFRQLVHPLMFGERLPFLPLLLVSVVCAVPIMLLLVLQQLRFAKAALGRQ